MSNQFPSYMGLVLIQNNRGKGATVDTGTIDPGMEALALLTILIVMILVLYFGHRK